MNDHDIYEPWQPQIGQRVRFRMGERPRFSCAGCNTFDFYQPIRVTGMTGTIMKPPFIQASVKWTCPACGYEQRAPSDLDNIFPHAVALDERTQGVDGVFAAAAELEPLDRPVREGRVR